DQTRHIHVGSFFLQRQLRPGLPRLFEEARKRGVTTSLDVGWDDSGNWDYGIAEVLKFTDIFLPNDQEATRIAGMTTVEEALPILTRYAGQVVVKCGAEGAAFMDKDAGEIVRQAGFKTKPVDTTGAGDSFNAGYIYASLQGYS